MHSVKIIEYDFLEINTNYIRIKYFFLINVEKD